MKFPPSCLPRSPEKAAVSIAWRQGTFQRWTQARAGKVPGGCSPAHQARCPLRASLRHHGGGYLRESPSCWTTEHLSLSHSLGKELFFSPALSKMQISWLCYKSHAGEADREVAPGWIWPYPFADPPASCVFLTQRLAQNYPFYKTPHFSVYKTALLCISSCFPQKP